MKTRPALLLLAGALVLHSGVARADGRYFVDVYPAHVDEAGAREMEVWSTALPGQADTTLTAWENRIAFEYAVTDRTTGSVYLNFTQAGTGEGATHFEGPSLQVIHAFAEPGKIPLDPSAYVYLRENGDEFEFEPALLLWLERGHWIAGGDFEGTFAFLHHVAPGAPTTEKSATFSVGLAHDLNAHAALGIEAQYARGFESSGDDPSALFVGPTLDLRAEKVGFTLGWHPQVRGTPKSAANLNLSSFPRSEFRMILSMEL